MSKSVRLDSVVGFHTTDHKNTRNAIPVLSKQNYCVFESELTGEGDDRVPLMRLARSDKDEDRKLFVSLIQKNEPEIYGMKDTFLSIGQKQPVLIKSSADGNLLIDGCRRFLARYVAHVELGDGADYDGTASNSIPAGFDDVDESGGEVVSIILNTHRKGMTFSEEALKYLKFKKAGMSVKAIAEKFGLDKNKGVNEAGQRTKQSAGEQRVAMFIRIAEGCQKGTGGATMDELYKVDTGAVAYTKLLKKIVTGAQAARAEKETAATSSKGGKGKSGGGSKGGKGKSGGGGKSSGKGAAAAEPEEINTERSTTRERTMTKKQLEEAVNDVDTLEALCAPHGFDVEAVRFGLYIALRRENEYEPYQREASSDSTEVVPSDEENAGDETGPADEVA